MDLKNKIKLSQQIRLLSSTIKSEKKFYEVLEEKGIEYDQLRYRNYVNGFSHENDIPQIDDLRLPNQEIPAVSFFSGAGGLDLGFEYAGFKTIASIENNELFCNTLRLNNNSRPVIGPPIHSGDLSKREEIASELRKIIGRSKQFNGVFHGGPPCQPFSIASNQRFKKGDQNFKRKGFNDEKKGNLLFDFIWFIKEFKPKAFVIENVPGLKDIDDGKQLSEAISKLEKEGYTISTPRVLNASYFGVPQNRNRLFVIGTKKRKKFNYPKESVFQMPCLRVFQTDFNSLENHETRKHSATSITRYMELDFGQRDKLGRVDRLNPFLPSKTVIAGGTKGGGRSHLHPYIPRTLSVRESAKLQTFPDQYIFTGSTARQFTQVGNAVPPKLAFEIATEVKKVI